MEDKCHPTEDERRKAIEHLRYEWEMLRETARIHDSVPRANALSREDAAMRYALVESFSVHARNLISFLYHEPQRDDVAARHFASDTHGHNWNRGKDRTPAELKDICKQASKWVAHLTYTRTGKRPEEPSLSCILDKIQPYLSDFKQDMKQEYLAAFEHGHPSAADPQRDAPDAPPAEDPEQVIPLLYDPTDGAATGPLPPRD